MADRTISHYRLLGVVGEGGMGVVYKAEDPRLHRFVALKLLSDRIAGDPVARDRFQREAEAASALNHPAICTIYDVGEADGRAFIAMEYLVGVPAPDGRIVNKLMLLRPGTSSRRDFDVAAAASDLAFTPDGAAITYLTRKGGAVNRHIQPLDGSPPRVTAASNNDVGGVVSPDGTQIAFLRGRSDSDVVLLRDGAAPRR